MKLCMKICLEQYWYIYGDPKVCGSIYGTMHGNSAVTCMEICVNPHMRINDIGSNI